VYLDDHGCGSDRNENGDRHGCGIAHGARGLYYGNDHDAGTENDGEMIVLSHIHP
jgi:hypothetical protein